MRNKKREKNRGEITKQKRKKERKSRGL